MDWGAGECDDIIQAIIRMRLLAHILLLNADHHHTGQSTAPGSNRVEGLSELTRPPRIGSYGVFFSSWHVGRETSGGV